MSPIPSVSVSLSALGALAALPGAPVRSALLEAVGWALVHSLWQGALLAALVALALRWVDRRAAALRYGLACAALALLPLLVVGTAWSAYVPPAPDSPPALEAQAAPARASQWRTERAAEPAAPAAALVEDVAVQGPGLGARLQAQVTDALPWLVLAWGLGVAVCSLRILRGHVQLRRLVREAQPAPAEWQARLSRLAGRMGLGRSIALLQTQGLDGPATLGWLVPVVLVPVSALAGLPPRQLEMVLAHELAHIRRHDFAVNLVQALVETLFFYHPAAQWLGRTVREEREHCCDDLAVEACGSAVSYARALTALEALRLPSLHGALPALSATGGSLGDRVRRLVLPPRTACRSRWLAGASALTLASSLAVAAPLSLLVLPAVVPVTLSGVVPPPETSPAPENELIRSPALLAQSAPPVPRAAAPAPAAPAAPPAPAARPAPVARPAPAARATPRPAPEAQGVDEAVDEAVQDALAESRAEARAEAKDKQKDKAKDKQKDKARDRDEEEDQTRVGSGPLSVEQLIRLRTAGVTGQRVQELQAMGFTPTVGNLVQFGHAGVTPEYVKEMRATFGNALSADELVQLRHLGVSTAFVQSLRAQGYTGLKPEDVIGARAVGVNEDYIRELKALGYPKLPLEQLQELRALGVSGDYVRELQQLGYTGLDVGQLTELRAMGVTAKYVQSLKDAGFTKLGVADLVRLRAGGVDADYVRELQGKRTQ